jgi:hypothetical protein
VHYKKERLGVFELESLPKKMDRNYKTHPVRLDLSMREYLPALTEELFLFQNKEFCIDSKYPFYVDLSNS